MKTKLSTQNIVIIGIFAAITAILSSLPTGIYILGMPATLQTFAIAFVGFTLGTKLGTLATVVYILMGAVGLPVFNGFKGGLSVIFGLTGGFIFGFIVLVALCGAIYKTKKRSPLKIVFPFLGLIIFHLIGILQFCFITKTDFFAAMTVVSLPYFIKDIIFVIVGYFVAIGVRRALKSAFPQSF